MHEELLQFYVPCLFRMEVLVLVFWYALNNRRWEVGRGAIFFFESSYSENAGHLHAVDITRCFHSVMARVLSSVRRFPLENDIFQGSSTCLP